MAGAAIPMWSPIELLHEGAEATVTAGRWMGKPAVLKMRRPRGYRHPDLDRRLTRSRLAVEVRALGRLQRLGFPSPSLIDCDIEESWILISRIEGRPLHDAIADGSAGCEAMEIVGALIRRLHEEGISHGDMTTHNILIDDSGELSMIDFGLARVSPELEQMGLDLQVLNECLTASHSELGGAIESVVRGYLDTGNDQAGDVVSRFEAIKGRVRYHG
ncbi:MAG: KEOPS complex kinase/ATPase Bud32 [Candidatus Thermoplasmatota archaeon]|nr:KEOPS complex kinase/ATPase Bud32 [Candidatus Thermoplasmatota archaeon]MEE3269800.1 KEOPS complex kinase/ATPase Bud32 [Candidatus Thermoplasmatota archaeon]